MPRVRYYSYLFTVGQMGGWGMGDNARGYRAGARASLLFAASMDAAPWKHVVHAPLNAVVCKKKSAFLMTFHAKLLSCTRSMGETSHARLQPFLFLLKPMYR